ncbi:MAG: ACP S-malonyltransferase [Chloroflexi bacterium]|nr:ACP S-malonyltransferase [Chloroflexota bacterium]
MGKELSERSAAARRVFQEADEVLGLSLSQLCFEGPPEVLRQTINAQPAIMTASVAFLAATYERLNGQVRPAFVAGHSLGEYTALVAAGVLPFAEVLQLVRERGRLMHEAGQRVPGGMVAILGLDLATVEEVCWQTGAQVANLNSVGQIVLSGTRQALAWALDLARVAGARKVIPLDVSGAFHSELMRPAMIAMAKVVEEIALKDPAVPIVSNTTAQPLRDAEAIRRELVAQLCGCVYWQRSVEFMVRAGVGTFYEVGPGDVLSGLIKRIDRNVAASNVGVLLFPEDGRQPQGVEQ